MEWEKDPPSVLTGLLSLGPLVGGPSSTRKTVNQEQTGGADQPLCCDQSSPVTLIEEEVLQTKEGECTRVLLLRNSKTIRYFFHSSPHHLLQCG